MSKPKRRVPRPAPKLAPKAKRTTDAKSAHSISGRSKLDLIIAALRAPKGATLADLMKLTGWQSHSVRGALAGALKKRGLIVTSAKTDHERIYRIGGAR